MCDTLRHLAATKSTFHHFSKDINSVMIFMKTDGLFNGLLCKAVSTSATYVFIRNGSSRDHFLSATDPVSRNSCTKSVIIDSFGAVSPGYFC
ncbi:hypothetical protein TNCV_370111 [Trichonephila clavipes]|nr:hypothetical protein TNCV_370111 [Trichonephila clavipes]